MWVGCVPSAPFTSRTTLVESPAGVRVAVPDSLELFCGSSFTFVSCADATDATAAKASTVTSEMSLWFMATSSRCWCVCRSAARQQIGDEIIDLRAAECGAEILRHHAVPVRRAIGGAGNDVGVGLHDGLPDVLRGRFRLSAILARAHEARGLCRDVAEIRTDVPARPRLGHVVTGHARQRAEQFLAPLRVARRRGVGRRCNWFQ